MRWIALHLPLLSLESFMATLAVDAGGATASRPIALMDAHRIVSADAAAQALGVKAGLKRATALALAPQLVLGRADPARDAQALEPVAHAALAFTPTVVIQPPDEHDQAAHTVLLEVEASLRYFDGRLCLLQCLQAALAPLNHVVHTVDAPNAQGAALLARVHRRLHCDDLEAMQKCLDAAPVWLLGPGSAHWEALQGMGLRTLYDLRSVPRSGLARRFGEPLLNGLDRALGLAPDPRLPIVLPAVFESRLELFARADTTEQVLHGAGLLLARLVPWLAAQHALVRRFTLTMQHEVRRLADAAAPRATTLEIALAEPSRDSAHLLVLLRERLGRLELPAPTLDLVLRADDIARRAPPNQELFATSRSEREGLTQLIERLQARLGVEQVQRLHRVEDHRPECGNRIEGVAAGGGGGVVIRPGVVAGAGVMKKAGFDALKLRHPRAAAQALSPPLEGKAALAAAVLPKVPAAGSAAGAVADSVRPRRSASPRPVWLLQEPEPLPERRSRPLLGGEPLQLLSGPERIEAGWWDAGLAERDYFIAQAADGALVWIYRARLPLSAEEGRQGWFMQGRFG